MPEAKPEPVDRSAVYRPEKGIPGRAQEPDCPPVAHSGPHLLIDDYLIAEISNVERVVIPPRRDAAIPNPIVTAREDHCFQPFLTILRDPDTGRYRLWYGAWRDDKRVDRSCLATMESADGVHFEGPPFICDTPEIQFGSQVIDRGKGHPDRSSRYVYSYWLGGGLRILKSADGLHWRPLADRVVLPHDHDITNIAWDSIRRSYAATVSTYVTGRRWSGKRRTAMMSFSQDLLQWEAPWFVLTPNDKLDEGVTQFYAMAGYLIRGSLRVAMVKILRDDLKAAGTQAGSFGRAHTCLAWSRDGRTWVRDRAKFFEPDGDPNAWDHAHAWIDEQVIVGDVVHLYYGGYRQGHKTNRFDERQIGLVKMPLDRYVARRAGGGVPGVLRTVPIRLDESSAVLQVNADASSGSVRVQLRDAASGAVLPGMSFIDCEPITADGLRQPVQWRRDRLSGLTEKVIRIEFEMTRSDLFAFEFTRQADHVGDVGEPDSSADGCRRR